MRIAEIWTYPVKSCVGIRTQAAEVDEYGVVGDRQFVVVDSKGALLTQRNTPILNLVKVEPSHGSLHFSAPGRPDLDIDAQASGETIHVTLYDGPAPGTCMGEAAALWLTETVGKSCRLLRSDALFERNMAPVVAHLFLSEQRRFPDCAPIHLISQESLDALNQRLDAPVEMSRFRPNIVIEGSEPFGEDKMRRLKIGDMLFDYMGVAERCAIPSIAPDSTRRGVEPLRTLRDFRLLEQKFYTGVAFGAYFRPIALGRIEQGQPITVLAEGEAQKVQQGA